MSKSSRGFDTVACGVFDGSKVLQLRQSDSQNKGLEEGGERVRSSGVTADVPKR